MSVSVPLSCTCLDLNLNFGPPGEGLPSDREEGYTNPGELFGRGPSTNFIEPPEPDEVEKMEGAFTAKESEELMLLDDVNSEEDSENTKRGKGGLSALAGLRLSGDKESEVDKGGEG